jgi:hypothetical protein
MAICWSRRQEAWLVFSRVEVETKKRKKNKDADITIWYTSTENHHM